MVDLIRFIERKTGIVEHLIGSVEVGDESSRLEIHKSVAFRAMKGLEQFSIQNRQVRIDLIRSPSRR
ncbi:MAG: DbpA RNA binding domain-containing protein [Euryarchaeota archaeon]|nr:DbpA RNA binding domain-containing protein [Euryarchaeota archaeon]